MSFTLLFTINILALLCISCCFRSLFRISILLVYLSCPELVPFNQFSVSQSRSAGDLFCRPTEKWGSKYFQLPDRGPSCDGQGQTIAEIFEAPGPRKLNDVLLFYVQYESSIISIVCICFVLLNQRLRCSGVVFNLTLRCTQKVRPDCIASSSCPKV